MTNLGVSMDVVPTGQALYTVMTAGTSAAMVAKGAEHDGTAASFSPYTLSPLRLTCDYVWSWEDSAQLIGMEEALRADLGEVMSQRMDDQLINGNGTAPNVSGFLNELTDASAETTEETFDSYIAKAASGIDGKYADSMSQVTILCGVGTKRHAIKEFRSNGDMSADDRMTARMAGFTASAAFGLLGSNKRQRAMMYRNGGSGPNAHLPVWEGVRFFRDEISAAKAGRISLTALMLYSFKIVREDVYTMLDYKIAA